jgi:hypothetical protein
LPMIRRQVHDLWVEFLDPAPYLFRLIADDETAMAKYPHVELRLRVGCRKKRES